MLPPLQLANTTLRSNPQRVRVASERWLIEQSACPACSGAFTAHPANTPVADVFCPRCQLDFELKSSAKAMPAVLVNGAYETMIKRLASPNPPALLFLHYAAADGAVRSLTAIPSQFFHRDLIIKRAPLSATARRAGWVGCNIALGKIPHSARVALVEDGIAIQPSSISQQWQQLEPLRRVPAHRRGWLHDVLAIVETLPREFSLAQVYQHSGTLAALHPENNNIEAKIRQQLQLLRDLGLLQFLQRGQYRRCIEH